MDVSRNPTRADELSMRAQVNRAEVETIADTFDESTGASWLWALLFGPIYYAVHGFWGQALIVFLLNFIVIGVIVSPFLAYPAWRARARKKAENMLLLENFRR